MVNEFRVLESACKAVPYRTTAHSVAQFNLCWWCCSKGLQGSLQLLAVNVKNPPYFFFLLAGLWLERCGAAEKSGIQFGGSGKTVTWGTYDLFMDYLSLTYMSLHIELYPWEVMRFILILKKTRKTRLLCSWYNMVIPIWMWWFGFKSSFASWISYTTY